MKSWFLVCLVATALCGCGGESGTAGPDPRFATADALVAYFNELTTTAPANARAVCELYYAENDQQTQSIAEHLDYVGVLELHEALFNRFGKGYFPDMKSAFVANGPASITDRQPGRVLATYDAADGEARTLELVQFGDRWWLSAKVLEEARAGITAEHREEVAMVFRGVAAAGRDIIPRINRGEFQTFDEAGRALWTRAAQVDPELRQHLQGAGGGAGGDTGDG